MPRVPGDQRLGLTLSGAAGASPSQSVRVRLRALCQVTERSRLGREKALSLVGLIDLEDGARSDAGWGFSRGTPGDHNLGGRTGAEAWCELGLLQGCAESIGLAGEAGAESYYLFKHCFCPICFLPYFCTTPISCLKAFSVYPPSVSLSCFLK